MCKFVSVSAPSVVQYKVNYSRNGCVIIIRFCLVFSFVHGYLNLTCPYVKACRMGESSYGSPNKFFQKGVQRRHFAYFFQVADVTMQTDVHKTLYCFYTTKKMPHESTRSISIYLKIFCKWSCIRIGHKGVLSFIRYRFC